jgi:hypothetical protein
MFTQDMSTHGNFERLTHLPFAPPINMKALSNVRQRTANGMANSRPFATVENAGFTVAPHCSFLDNTLRTIDKAVAIFVIGLLLAVGRWHLQFGGASVHHRNIDI